MKLVICYTPLHVLIVERLIALRHIENYYLLYICFAPNPKHIGYFERLKKGSEGASFIVMKHSIVHDGFALSKWYINLSKELVFDSVFVGNQKHFYSRIVAWMLSIRDFNTFDDGSGNISGDGYLYDLKENFVSNLFFSLLSPRYLYKNLAKGITQHFSIYDEKNVCDEFNVPKEKIALLENLTSTGTNQGNPDLVVYIGNAFDLDRELTEEQEYKLDKSVIEYFGVNKYLPHPRRTNLEQLANIGNIEICSSSLISEEIIINQLNSYKKILIIGSYSSTMLNLAGIENIELINIHVDLKKPTSGLLEIFDKLNIKTLKLDDLSVKLHE